MNRHRSPSPSAACAIAGASPLSRDELTALVVAIGCAIGCMLFLGLPVVAHAEEGDGTNPALEEVPGEVSGEVPGDPGGLGDASVPEAEDLAQAPEDIGANGDAGVLSDTGGDAVAAEVPDGTSTNPTESAGADAAPEDGIVGKLAEDLAEVAPGASPAPSNPMPLIIVVAIMGVALAVAFVVSRIRSKPQKLGGAKGDVW